MTASHTGYDPPLGFRFLLSLCLGASFLMLSIFGKDYFERNFFDYCLLWVNGLALIFSLPRFHHEKPIFYAILLVIILSRIGMFPHAGLKNLCFDGLICTLLFIHLRKRKESVRWMLLYALHPLILSALEAELFLLSFIPLVLSLGTTLLLFVIPSRFTSWMVGVVSVMLFLYDLFALFFTIPWNLSTNLMCLLPILVLNRSGFGLIFTLSAGCALLPRTSPIPIFLLIWLPPLFFMLMKKILVRPLRLPPTFGQPQSLGIVIPTFNEEDNIEVCLKQIFSLPKPFPQEVIVVDGGSQDRTLEKIKTFDVKLLHAKGGRGGQISAGVSETVSDVVLIAHADNKLEEYVCHDIMAFLKKNPHIAGGALGQRFDSNRIILRVLEMMNDFRATLLGVSFGDQGQFFRKEALEGIGGYPDIPLMEDVELSYRLRKTGPQAYLWGGVCSSPRRWFGNPILPKIMQVILLVLRYSFRRRTSLQTDDLYKEYYG